MFERFENSYVSRQNDLGDFSNLTVAECAQRCLAVGCYSFEAGVLERDNEGTVGACTLSSTATSASIRNARGAYDFYQRF